MKIELVLIYPKVNIISSGQESSDVALIENVAGCKMVNILKKQKMFTLKMCL